MINVKTIIVISLCFIVFQSSDSQTVQCPANPFSCWHVMKCSRTGGQATVHSYPYSLERHSSQEWSMADLRVMGEVFPYGRIIPMISLYPQPLEVLFGTDDEAAKSIQSNGVWKKFAGWYSISIIGSQIETVLSFSKTGLYTGCLQKYNSFIVKDSLSYYPGTNKIASYLMAMSDGQSDDTKPLAEVRYSWHEATNTIKTGVVYTYSADSVWRCSDSIVFIYSPTNAIAAVVEFECPTDSSALRFYSRDSLFYSADGTLSEMITYDSLNGKTDRMQFSYTPARKCSAIIGFSWNAGQQTWRNSTLTRYHYNSIDMADTMEIGTWDTLTAQWKIFGKEAYSYASDGQSSAVIFFQFSQNRTDSRLRQSTMPSGVYQLARHSNPSFYESSAWQSDSYPTNRFSFAYTPGGTLISALSETWDAPLQAWKSAGKTVYGYHNTTGKPVSINKYLFNSDDSSWTLTDSSVIQFHTESPILKKVISRKGTNQLMITKTATSLQVELTVKPHDGDYLLLHTVQGKKIARVEPQPASGRTNTCYMLEGFSSYAAGAYLLTISSNGRRYQTVITSIQ
ncbi:MAG: hypothetical protein JW795_04195 [Chitinivibrionales bacterium]|nr:hypothetical protein [Chitinivibrionales bacterium]